MAQRKIPMRMCLGCGEMKPKRELMRIVRSPEGEISADPTGKRSGRGAYICPSADCVRAAKKSRRLEKNFSCRIDESVYELLAEAAEKYAAEKASE